MLRKGCEPEGSTRGGLPGKRKEKTGALNGLTPGAYSSETTLAEADPGLTVPKYMAPTVFVKLVKQGERV